MRRLLALALALALAPAYADDSAKAKAKKAENRAGKALEDLSHKLWISPSDKERKQKAAKAKDAAK
jgi:hypothetical protein